MPQAAPTIASPSLVPKKRRLVRADAVVSPCVGTAASPPAAMEDVGMGDVIDFGDVGLTDESSEVVNPMLKQL